MREGTVHSAETKQKIAQANNGRRHTPEELSKMRLAHLGKRHSAETKAKISETHLGERNPNYSKHPSPETRAKLSASRSGEKNPFYGKHHTDETREILKLASSGPNNFNFGKPRPNETVRKIILSNHLKPNKAEQKLQTVLNTHFPSQWKFVGDGQFIVGGLCPDFRNRKNDKLILELFGDHWHSDKMCGKYWRRTELGRIMHYNALGFKCLIIWEHELKDENQLIKKIRKWA